MTCPNCKSEIFDKDNFCAHCGKKLKDACNCWVKKRTITIVEKAAVLDMDCSGLRN